MYDMSPREDRIRALTLKIRRLQQELALLETADVDPPNHAGNFKKGGE